MRTGIYKKKRIDWSSFEVDKFVPHLFTLESYGCGANALALLTGVPPSKIESRIDWTDKFMVKYLRKAGFTVKEVTMCDVSNNNGFFIPSNINDLHVLLISHLMTKNEASWSIVHNKLYYHNFQTCSFTGLNLVNNPLLTCYLIMHPNWKVS